MQCLHRVIAHETAVNSISFNDANVFATGGDDASVRYFDMRNLVYSNIIYQTRNPILNVLWNSENPNNIAILTKNNSNAIIVDIRKPNEVQTTLPHNAQVNCAAWYPGKPGSNVLSTSSEDSISNIWEVQPEEVGFMNGV